jgi:hypothetical protein
VIGTERWRENWLVVSPHDALRVDLGRSRVERDRLKQRIRELPCGSPVVLVASAPGAIRRCRSFAAAANVHLESEYLAFPSAHTPAYLVEDDPAPVRFFVRTILVAPPRHAFARPLAAVLGLLRVVRPWRLIRAIAPGRLAVGRRV